MNSPENSVLELFRCPVTHSKLRLMEAAELEGLNEQIRAGKINERKGDAVSVEIETGLINADGTIGWPILGGIMQLIADEGIDLSNVTN